MRRFLFTMLLTSLIGSSLSSSARAESTQSATQINTFPTYYRFGFGTWRDIRKPNAHTTNAHIPDGELRFESNVWKANVSNYDRLRMVSDLVQNHLVRGMSRHQVQDLLGLSSFPVIADPENPEWFKETHWYSLHSNWCANAPQKTLELAFENGCLIRYRFTTARF